MDSAEGQVFANEQEEVRSVVRSIFSYREKPLVVITGAGMSADSGIPTFRGSGETWRGYSAMQLANQEMFDADPRMVWDWYLYRRQVVHQAKPHAGHQALAAWLKEQSSATLVTQNVDDMHEQSGVTALHVHGSLWRNRCTKCLGEREDRQLSYEGGLPRSPCCDALERPAIVWFGESLDSGVMNLVVQRLFVASYVVVIGTSGMVAPMNLVVNAMKNLGKTVIEINPEPAFAGTVKIIGRAIDLLPELCA